MHTKPKLLLTIIMFCYSIYAITIAIHKSIMLLIIAIIGSIVFLSFLVMKLKTLILKQNRSSNKGVLKVTLWLKRNFELPF